MRTFLIVAISLFALALTMVVGAFFYVQFLLAPDEGATTTDEVPVVVSESTASGTENVTKPTTTEETNVITKVEEPEVVTPDGVLQTPIPLRTLPLSDAQKTLLAGVGIDYETFIITPEMIVCAQDKLGTERFKAIVDGSSPSAVETMSLLRCL